MEGDSEAESCKVVLLGESGVGKTSIISQLMEQQFCEDQTATTGATFSTKTMEFENYDKAICFEIWDTAGQEKYRALTKMFYKDASIAILVYDITRLESFEELKKYWAEQVKEHAPKKIVIAVAANKSDLYENEKVDESQGRDFAKEIGALFKLTSAKNQTGIEELFKDCGSKFLDPNFECSADAKEEEQRIRQARGKSIKIKSSTNTQATSSNNDNDGTNINGFKDASIDKKKGGCCK
jgi:small GTP-binding protein